MLYIYNKVYSALITRRIISAATTHFRVAGSIPATLFLLLPPKSVIRLQLISVSLLSRLSRYGLKTWQTMPKHKQREDAKRELTHGQRFTILHSVYQPPMSIIPPF